jgi:hypothetical protein
MEQEKAGARKGWGKKRVEQEKAGAVTAALVPCGKQIDVDEMGDFPRDPLCPLCLSL